MAAESTMPLVEEPSSASPDAPVVPEATPEATPTPDSTPSPSPTPEEPKEPRFQRRINQLTRKIHDLERQLTAVATPPVSAPPTVPDQKPQEGNFTDFGEYVEALTDWKVRQARQQEITDADAQRERARIEGLSRDFAPQLEAARAKYDDFEDVVSQPIFTPLTQELLWQSPQGAEIAYYLGTHPQEAAALNAMAPLAAARRLVALEAQVQQATTPAKTVSTAPAPIQPVSGTPAAVKDPEKMTTDEWMAWEKQQRIERLKSRPLSI